MTDTRSQLESKLGGLHSIFKQFEDLTQHQASIYQAHDHRYVTYPKPWRAGMYWLWVLILTIAFSVINFSIGMMVFMSSMDSSAGEMDSATLVPMLGLFLLPLPLALIGAGVIVVMRNRRIKATNSKRETQNQEIAQQIATDTWPQIQQVQAQLKQASQEYWEHYSGWFPSNYLTASDVAQCWHIVHNHRASTVQEAINIYETILHRQRLEDSAAAQFAATQRTANLVLLGNIVNAAGHAATISTVRSQGAATRAVLNEPVRIVVKKR